MTLATSMYLTIVSSRCPLDLVDQPVLFLYCANEGTYQTRPAVPARVGSAVARLKGQSSLEPMRILPCCLALTILVTPLHAQALEDKITDLFIFGEGEQVLFLGGSGGSDDPTI